MSHAVQMRELPVELIRLTLTFMDLPDLSALEQVCHGLQQLVQEGHLWRGLCRSVYGVEDLTSKDLSWRALLKRLHAFDTTWSGKHCQDDHFPYPMGFTPEFHSSDQTVFSGHCYWWYFQDTSGWVYQSATITGCEGVVTRSRLPQLQFSEVEMVHRDGVGAMLGTEYTALCLDNCLVGRCSYGGMSGNFYVVASECTHDTAAVVDRLRAPEKRTRWHGTAVVEDLQFVDVSLEIATAVMAGVSLACPCCQTVYTTYQLTDLRLILDASEFKMPHGTLEHRHDALLASMQRDTHPTIPVCDTAVLAQGPDMTIAAEVRGRFLFGILNDKYAFKMTLSPS